MFECPADAPLEKLHEVERSDDFEPCQALHLGILAVASGEPTTGPRGYGLAHDGNVSELTNIMVHWVVHMRLGHAKGGIGSHPNNDHGRSSSKLP